MISGLDAASERLLADLGRIERDYERAQRELSSGLRLNTASDAPEVVADVIQIQTNLGLNEQLKTGLGVVKTETETAQSVLDEAISALDRARTIGVQAANGTRSAEERNIIAVEVRSLLERVVALSRTSVQGRFIFSGDSDQAASYEMDWTATTTYGVNRLVADAESSRMIQHPAGNQFQIAHTAQDIFDVRDSLDAPAVGNAFKALYDLVQGLETNDGPAIETALDGLSAASDHLNKHLSFYGTTVNTINEAISFSEKLAVRLKTELSSNRDANTAETILRLTQASMHREAALGAQANRPKGSLFDYLG